MCECKTVPGGVIICDHCASAMINAINGLLSGEHSLDLSLEGVMTQVEYNGLSSAVNGYFDLLEQEREGR